ncbi:ABC transporter transmembrane domain-containing protein [Buchnera aphidicola (Chaitoregma tattakana)]|uniref:ABC transporter transmembrane domain-containing protein n=1 Tax=Buchnera aphidicola TaxID=9 RepID=UPI0031B86E40
MHKIKFNFSPILIRLLKYGVFYKKKILYVFILLFSSSICEVLCPILISFFIKTIIETNTVQVNTFILVISSFVMLQIISALCNYFEIIIFSNISAEIIKKIRFNVMKSSLNQPMEIFDKQPIGQIVSKVTNDTETIKELYERVIPSTIRNIMLITIILITMFLLEWKMACISIIMFPVITTIMIIYQKLSTPIIRKVKSYIAEINNIFNETINGMQIIQQFNQEHRFFKKIKKISNLHYLYRMKILKLDGFLLRPLFSFCTNIILCGLILLFNYFPKEMFQVSTLYVFINYLNRLNEPMLSIINQQSTLQQSIVSGERIFNLIDSETKLYGEHDYSIKYGKIEIKKLNFAYSKTGQKVLKDINIKIRKKSFVAFVGHTGSGKSTLANLIIGNYKIKNGYIKIDDKKIEHISKKIITKEIAVVQQEPFMFTDTLFNNISLKRNIPKSKILKIIKKVKLEDLVKKNEKGIYMKIKEKGSNISQGQKQLISIARVLVTKPKILILDESTSNIDSKTEKKIQEVLLKIKNNITLIIIAHRLSTIVRADEIIVFNKGKIIEKGNHEELMKKRNFYWKMYMLQIHSTKIFKK